MKLIPDATVVVLTTEERQALAGSRKCKARMRNHARLVLLASAGMASRVIAWAVGCTPGTASKWRVRYACKRIAGLSETGHRGNDPNYGKKHGQRILALLYPVSVKIRSFPLAKLSGPDSTEGHDLPWLP